jgi:hypothetical protein
MLCWVTYPKFSPSTFRNKLLKFKPCRAKKCNSCKNMHQLNVPFGELFRNDMESMHAKCYEFIKHRKGDIDLSLLSFSKFCRLK